MKIQSSIIILIAIGSYIISLILLFIFQIIESKDFFLNVISIVVISLVFQYFFQKFVKHGELEDIVNKHYTEIFSFLDELFVDKSYASGKIDFITKYIDENRRELLKYFGFEKEDISPYQPQHYHFLRNKYNIDFCYTRELPSISIIDKGIKDNAKVPSNKAMELYNQMCEDIKNNVKKAFVINIREN